MLARIPPEAVGLRLYRIDKQERLIGCEAVMFRGGWAAIDTVLRRAQISGRTEVGGEVADHFVDVLDAKESIIETVALDAKSYGALKNRWMRCKTEPAP